MLVKHSENHSISKSITLLQDSSLQGRTSGHGDNAVGAAQAFHCTELLHSPYCPAVPPPCCAKQEGSCSFLLIAIRALSLWFSKHSCHSISTALPCSSFNHPNYKHAFQPR